MSKYLVWGLLGIAGIATGAYLIGLNRLSNELETTTRAIIHKITLTGLVIKVDFTLKNPSGGTVKVKQPFVKFQYGETVFASSDMENIDFEIPKFGQISSMDYDNANEDKAGLPKPIFITLNLLTLAMKVPGMLKEYRNNGSFKIDVTTISTINNKLPYKKTENITIGKEA